LTGERVVRRLAAILAADVVGYSRLMGRDESGTLTRLKVHRTERLEPALARHGGRLVKLTGDGALIEFPSAVDALSAAIEFQQAMATANEGLPEDTAIVFRIGLHLGDLIVDGDDLYGDGVNVAARLEAEAQSGGILISGDVYNAVVGRLKAAFVDLGELSLKNIERPVRAFRVPVDGVLAVSSAAAPSDAAEAPLALPDKPSIAVLPFQNMSGDPEQEYFADGMVEDIITALSRFKSLFVIARNSSFTYKGRIVDVKQVGRELGVRYVLEGSVRKAGGKVRITGQLIDSESGAHLWADRFDGSLEDVFELQDQVTTSVVGAIAPTLDQLEIERARRKPVENLDAYDCFLRGMAYSYMLTKDAQDEALRLFYRSIELDPAFSTPYGMAARCYAFRKVQGWIADDTREEAETRRLGLRLAAIGQDDALALCSAGYALLWVCHDFDVGTAMIDQALSINQNLAAGWIARASVSLYLGQFEAALEEFGRALRLNPKDSEIYRPKTGIGAVHFLQGRNEEALEWAARALAHQQGWRTAILLSAAANAFLGNVEDSRKFIDRVLQLDPGMRISSLKVYLPFRRPQDIEVWTEGLRLAGLPE
jgi:TolB-like protein/class 3 adenylate cyclase